MNKMKVFERGRIMKKTLVSLLLLIILSLLVNQMAFATPSANITSKTDDQKFDYTVLEKLKGYSYDKFNRAWSFYDAYTKKYSDAELTIGIHLEGTKESIQYPPMLYARIRKPNSRELLYTVTGLDILVDDTIFSYEKMHENENTESAAFLYLEGKQLVEALAKGTECSVRFHTKYGSFTIDIPKTEYNNTLKRVSKVLVILIFV